MEAPCAPNARGQGRSETIDDQGLPSKSVQIFKKSAKVPARALHVSRSIACAFIGRRFGWQYASLPGFRISPNAWSRSKWSRAIGLPFLPMIVSPCRHSSHTCISTCSRDMPCPSPFTFCMNEDLASHPSFLLPGRLCVQALWTSRSNQPMVPPCIC